MGTLERTLAGLALSVLALGACVARAGDQAASAPHPPQLPSEAAQETKAAKSGVVTLFNRPIARFRANFLAVPIAERVEAAERRIAARLEQGGPGVVTVEHVPQGALVKIDGALAFVVANEDVDQLGGEALDAVANDVRRNLERAIAETREARDTRRMLSAALWAGGATLVYAAALLVLRLSGRALTRRAVRLAGRKAGEITFHGTEVIQRERLGRLVLRVLQIGFWALVLLVTYQWLSFVLGLFPYTRPWGEHLYAFLKDTVEGILIASASAIPDLFVAAMILLLARAINGTLSGFFDGVQTGRIELDWLDRDSALPTRRLVSLVVWVFALAMAYPYIPGSGTEAFKGLSVLVGLMVSIGASGIVGQAASGLILMYTRTFRTGEYVRVAEHEGTVVEMGLFTTRVRTGLGEELTLPNSTVLGTVTKNYSRAVRGHGFIVDVPVTIGYDAPWRQVHAMLVEAARRTAGILADPAPRVFQTALSDFYVEYRLVAQAVPSGPAARAEVMSALRANVQDVFNEYGVQIMSPHYLGDPAEAKVVPRAHWYASPAAPEPGTRD